VTASEGACGDPQRLVAGKRLCSGTWMSTDAKRRNRMISHPVSLDIPELLDLVGPSWTINWCEGGTRFFTLSPFNYFKNLIRYLCAIRKIIRFWGVLPNITRQCHPCPVLPFRQVPSLFSSIARQLSVSTLSCVSTSTAGNDPPRPPHTPCQIDDRPGSDFRAVTSSEP